MSIGHILCEIASAFESQAATDRAASIEKPPPPARATLTERVLYHMLRENTGANILDSGGAYGRSWERNQAVDFASRPRASVQFWARSWHGEAPKIEVDVTIDLYHFLNEKLDYDRAMTRAFNRFAVLPDNEDKGWIEISELFPDWIAERRETDAEVIGCENSYNCDNFLSQTIQFVLFTMDHEQYCILQVHGGCDVRGGYTRPKVFRCTDEWSVCDYYRASIAPDWKEAHAIGEALKEALDRQPFLFPSVETEMRAELIDYGRDVWWNVGSFDDHAENCEALESYPVLEIEDRSQWRKGHVCVLPDHSALCPETGAKLVAGF